MEKNRSGCLPFKCRKWNNGNQTICSAAFVCPNRRQWARFFLTNTTIISPPNTHYDVVGGFCNFFNLAKLVLIIIWVALLLCIFQILIGQNWERGTFVELIEKVKNGNIQAKLLLPWNRAELPSSSCLALSVLDC